MKYVVANYRANLTLKDVKNYSSSFEEILPGNIKFIVCAQSPLMCYFSYKNYYMCSQNITQYDNNDCIGEISGEALKSIGCDFVIVGHNDYRKNNEDELIFYKKINNALKNNIMPIYCVGETKEERDRKKTFAVVERQLNKVFDRITNKNIIVAYEPRWAIGTGMIPSVEEINDIISFIKDYLLIKYRIEVKLLYGGSIDDNNIRDFEKIKKLDGYVIGASSLNLIKLNKILKSIQK